MIVILHVMVLTESAFEDEIIISSYSEVCRICGAPPKSKPQKCMEFYNLVLVQHCLATIS